MTHLPESESASVVMLGSFNPAIFQPHWLRGQGIIRSEEADSAKIEIIRPEVADFSVEWFQMQVLQNRFQITATDPRHYEPLRDLASSIFQILSHTPVTRLGINRSFHFKMPSTEVWHAVGHKLAPKEPWNRVMESPGLRSILMQGKRKAGVEGTLHVRVEPSVLVQPGLFIEVNEEFKAPDANQADGAMWVPGCVGGYWDAIMQYATEAAEHFLDLAKS